MTNEKMKKHSLNNQSQSSKLKAQSLKKGFTMVEMILVMSTLLILFSVTIGAYREERRRFDFNEGLNQILATIKEARNLTTNSEPFFEATAGTTQEERSIVPADGYGVKIEVDSSTLATKLILFANKGPDNHIPSSKRDSFQNEPSEYERSILDSSDLIIRTITLPENLRFKFFVYDYPGTGTSLDPTPRYNLPSNPDAFETTLMYRPLLADLEIFEDDNNNNPANPMDSVQIVFENLDAPSTSGKRCHFISLNKNKGTPEHTFSNTGCDYT